MRASIYLLGASSSDFTRLVTTATTRFLHTVVTYIARTITLPFATTTVHWIRLVRLPTLYTTAHHALRRSYTLPHFAATAAGCGCRTHGYCTRFWFWLVTTLPFPLFTVNTTVHGWLHFCVLRYMQFTRSHRLRFVHGLFGWFPCHCTPAHCPTTPVLLVGR